MDQKKTPARLYQTPMKRAQDADPKWFVFDAAGKTLGRFASEIAKVLRGKHSPEYTPHADTGDGVIVVNAEKIQVSGSKAVNKNYRHYTGYISGLRTVPFDVMLARKPAFIIEHAVKGMMPRTRLGRKQLKKLRIFVGEQHQMNAQQPVKVSI